MSNKKKRTLSQAEFREKVAEIRGPGYVAPNAYQAFADGGPVKETAFVIPTEHKTR